MAVYGGRDVTDPKTKSRKEGAQFCDVFCTIRLGKQKYQTEIIKHSQNPVWQTSFELYVLLSSSPLLGPVFWQEVLVL